MHFLYWDVSVKFIVPYISFAKLVEFYSGSIFRAAIVFSSNNFVPVVRFWRSNYDGNKTFRIIAGHSFTSSYIFLAGGY